MMHGQKNIKLYTVLSHGTHFATCFGLNRSTSGKNQAHKKDVRKHKHTSLSNMIQHKFIRFYSFLSEF